MTAHGGRGEAAPARPATIGRPALSTLLAAALLLGGCATTPPADPLAHHLQAGEPIVFRAPAQLLHGHDMEEPRYDPSDGYRPIPAYRGELALTDRRLLFAVRPATSPPAWVSIPFTDIARARPSRTSLLNYIVVWDRDHHPDAFHVSAGDVRELHRQVGLALLRQVPPAAAPAAHTLANPSAAPANGEEKAN